MGTAARGALYLSVVVSVMACSAVTSFDDFVGTGERGSAEGGAPLASSSTEPPPPPKANDGGTSDADVSAPPPSGTCTATQYREAAAVRGADTWTGGANALAGDGTFATSAVGADLESGYLIVEQFGFTIPAAATVTGYEIVIVRKASGSDDIRDEVVQLLGSKAYADRASGQEWAPAAETRSYASSNGEPMPTAAEVNATTLAVRVSVKNHGTLAGTAFIDVVRVAVSYCD